MNRLGVIALLTALLGMLAGSIWYAYGLWNAVETAELPTELYVALAGGVIFSIVIGSGLMALVFYSSRYGYDDEASGHDRHGR